MSFNYAVFEIAAHVFTSVSDPHDHQEVAAQIGKSKGQVITGSYDFTSGPVKNVAVHDDFAGQWQKSKDPKFMYDLYVVNNAMDSSVPVTASLRGPLNGPVNEADRERSRRPCSPCGMCTSSSGR